MRHSLRNLWNDEDGQDVADGRFADAADQLHQRPRAEAAPGVDRPRDCGRSEGLGHLGGVLSRERWVPGGTR